MFAPNIICNMLFILGEPSTFNWMVWEYQSQNLISTAQHNWHSQKMVKSDHVGKIPKLSCKKGWRLGHIGPIYSLQAILCPKIKDTSQAYCWQLVWIRFIRFISGCQRGRGFQMYRWLGPEKTIWWFDEKYQLVILGMLLTRVTYWYTYRSSKTYRPSYLDYLHINFLKANQSSFPVILQPPTCKLFLELALISHN